MVDIPSLATLRLDVRGFTLLVHIDQPQSRNALSRAVREDLSTLCEFLEQDTQLRAVVLRGAGGMFCSGGDLREFERNLQAPLPRSGDRDAIALDNRQFGALLLRLRAVPQVFIVLVEGAAFGGALGLVSIADVGIAVANARFAVSETSIGVIPAQIAPFVIARVGLTHARRLALTAERFDGVEAQRLGFVHFVFDTVEAAETHLTAVLKNIARCGREANAATKQLLTRAAEEGEPSPSLLEWAADCFAQRLRSAEGQEGVNAFLQKRKPSWLQD